METSALLTAAISTLASRVRQADINIDIIPNSVFLIIIIQMDTDAVSEEDLRAFLAQKIQDENPNALQYALYFTDSKGVGHSRNLA